MRVFVAGSTGAIGRSLVPQLAEEGHAVTALVRTPKRSSEVEALGATAAVADAFDREALFAVIRRAEPEIIIHELTALPRMPDLRKFDEEFALTNRLRTEVTDTLLAAARLVHARRFIAQSYCGWSYARDGAAVKTEEDPLDPTPPASVSATLEAIRYVEDAVRRAGDVEALALRYGAFYGPGTGIADDGPVVDLVRRRRLPIVGDGAGVWSFVHIRDAARATVAAMSHGAPGIYNVVDDDPAPVAEWLPFLASAIGAKPPRRVPAWLGRLFVGEAGVAMMTSIRGGSNAKARRELAWEPIYPSWRRGFVEGLGERGSRLAASGA